MDYHRKYVIATLVVAVAFGIVIWGLGRIQAEALSGHVRGFTKVVFFGSGLVGVSAAVCRYYFKSMSKRENDGQKIAMETLGELGRQKMADKKHNKLN